MAIQIWEIILCEAYFFTELPLNSRSDGQYQIILPTQSEGPAIHGNSPSLL